MKNVIKKFFLFMLAAVLMLTCASLTAFADENEEDIPKVYYKDDDNSDVRLVIGSTEEVTIGKSSTISITLKNNSGEDWTKTYVWIAGEEDYKDYYDIDDDEEDSSDLVRSMKTTYPFEIIDSLSKQKSIGSINDKSRKTVNMKVSMKKDLEQGYYPVLIHVLTENENGNQREYAKTMFIWAKAKSATEPTEKDETGTEPVAFALGENQATPHGIYGEVMNFEINLRNTGYRTAYDVRVEMGLSANVKEFPFEINDGNYDRWMNNIGANESVQVPYSMAIQEGAASGYYPIKFKIRYREEENGAFAEPIEDVMYVRIVGKQTEDELSADAGENERTKARIIVDSFETEPETVYAGQDFILRVKMKNASDKISASNILFTLEPESVSDSPVFTTVNGSNSAVVNNLAPGASAVLEMHYNSSPSAEQRSYTITITEQYDSPEFKNAKETVKFAVPIKQQARLNTGNIEVMPNAINVGGETNIMFDINNTGKVILYNVTATFEDDSIQRSENYIGNIKPGESGNVDAMIYGVAPTMDDGMITVKISYEDENGTVSSVDKEIQLYVSEPMPMEDPFTEDFLIIDEPLPEPTVADKLKQYALPLGVAAAAVLGGIVFFIRRKKKKAGMEDEIL
ncbi:MAG: hypothetical protein IKU20_11525 [Lachnospiraceae bacterium]|nr:hypothetical protein [Lachnospiraceae bacterium]